MREKKKPVTLEELQKLIEANETSKTPTKRDALKNKYKVSLRNAQGEDIDALDSKGKYSLRSKIKNNPWVKNRPASQAHKWLYQDVFKNPGKYRYNKLLLQQGGLFTFEYKNPKYKDTSVLPYFDQYPLVVSLGPTVTSLGVRVVGFNLHMLPPAVRVITLCMIFEQNKRLYRYQIFSKTLKPVKLDYRSITRILFRYGVKFSVRMYIPQRIRQCILFPYTDWYKAIFIPSRAYYGIRANKLIKEWQAYCRKDGVSINPRIDWRAIL